MPVLKQICMYCRRQYGTKDSQGAPAGDSHGICDTCVEKSDAELDALAAKYVSTRFKDFTK